MTKKDYVAVADSLALAYEDVKRNGENAFTKLEAELITNTLQSFVGTFLTEFSDKAEKDSPRFDRSKFRQYVFAKIY